MDIIPESYDGQGVGEQKKLFRIPESKKGKVLFAVAGSLVLGILLVSTVFFGDFIGTRAIGFGGPRTSVRQGETVSLKFVTRQGPVGRRVEICSKTLLKTSCKALVFKVGKNALTVDTVIPINYKLGRADLRLVGIYRNGARVLLGSKGIMVLPYVAQNSGGGSSSDSSDSGSSSTPTPTPPLPYGPY